jgi:hypothetical protein
MRKATFGLAALVVPAIIGAVLAGGCDKVKDAADSTGEDLCGPCGVVAEGDVGISGNAKLDGFFKAVADLNGAALKVQANFAADLAALELAFGLPKAEAGAELSARVDALILKIQGEIDANAEGGLTIRYAPPKCSANLSVAVDAQAKCEAKAGCDVEVDPGNIQVECSGTCSGECSGECSGDFSCKAQAPSIECSGKCEGSCELEAAATCEGTCHGQCDGTCSVQDAEGNCNGECDGDCTGSCELSAAAECSGKCSGSCLVDQGSTQCKGNVECQGECKAECSGGCEGEATPPSASAKCKAEADCQAQASAQASANVECKPPSLDIGFDFKADVEADAQAQFMAEIDALKVHGIAMLQGVAQYQALFTGKVDGKVVFETAPIKGVQVALQGVIDDGIEGKLTADIPVFRLNCAFDALSASVKMLKNLGADAEANFEAQAKFAGELTGGFKS